MSSRSNSGMKLGREEAELVLSQQRRHQAAAGDRQEELELQENTSLPPFLERMLEALPEINCGETSDEEFRAGYSRVNRNPRLPSQEESGDDRRIALSSRSFGGTADQRKSSRAIEEASSSLFSWQPDFGSRRESEPAVGNAFNSQGDGLIGLKESFINDLQKGFKLAVSCSVLFGISYHLLLTALFHWEDLARGATHLRSPSFPQNYNPFGHAINSSNTSDNSIVLRHEDASLSGLQSGGRVQNAASFLPTGSSSTSLLGSHHVPSGNAQYGDLVSALSRMNLSGMNVRTVNTYDDNAALLRRQQEIESQQIYALNSQGTENLGVQQPVFIRIGNMNFSLTSFPLSAMPMNTGFELNNMTVRPEGQVDLRGVPAPFPVQYQNLYDANAAYATVRPNEYMVNPVVPAMLSNSIWATNVPRQFHRPSAALLSRSHGVECLDPTALAAAFSSGQPMNYAVGAAPVQHAEPDYMQYLRMAERATEIAANSGESSVPNPYDEILGIQKAYLGALIQPDRQVAMQGQVTSNVPSNLSGPMPFIESPLLHPGMRNLSGSVDTMATTDESAPVVLLEELKNSKTRGLQLHDVLGHVVGFCTDQYGSRFVQQQLENCTAEEMQMVLDEILPEALPLMNDVFGNYVIQKFFEFGTHSQIRALADKLTGHVLKLSFQMYSCRVIQKAIECIELDQQIKLVQEFNGHVIESVFDQNGNHVIQKCIESIPYDAIRFMIISFFGQVKALSSHPYGCRVMQRVLENCPDPDAHTIVLGEIMESVIDLAKDQYGNYVIQHVIERGKPEERSAIIREFIGQIVSMSQQKFASNVVEKCFVFGSPEERQVFINEILGYTEENEPLQEMMKDQFGNYVVQKILETVDNQQRQLILSRIKVHYNSLKRYTFGKHIFTRVEKLAASECT
ncbi:putative armadillo-like helical, nucleic acid binding NABP, pumilio domain-containing protein [Dioscorea sansibarensis]